IQCYENMLSIHRPRVRGLQLWASAVREILQRYTITINILQNHPEIGRAVLEKESQSVAQRLAVLHGINAPEFFDRAVFSTFINNLKDNGYFNEAGNGDVNKLKELSDILDHMISAEILLTIKGAIDKADEEAFAESVTDKAEGNE
ncbi:MAG: glycerol-3-phosphate 1-O-acyltransferase, partial [[Actinobacillus] rossii]|nr:glycerol-3-phosphate 1-O-acyltransferase [[Actinobacillus] rossii]